MARSGGTGTRTAHGVAQAVPRGTDGGVSGQPDGEQPGQRGRGVRGARRGELAVSGIGREYRVGSARGVRGRATNDRGGQDTSGRDFTESIAERYLRDVRRLAPLLLWCGGESAGA